MSQQYPRNETLDLPESAIFQREARQIARRSVTKTKRRRFTVPRRRLHLLVSRRVDVLAFELFKAVRIGIAPMAFAYK